MPVWVTELEIKLSDVRAGRPGASVAAGPSTDAGTSAAASKDAAASKGASAAAAAKESFFTPLPAKRSTDPKDAPGSDEAKATAGAKTVKTDESA